MSTPTPTPRSDYAAFKARIVTPEFLGGTSNVVTHDFAQELERELSDMQARAEAAEAACVEKNVALKVVLADAQMVDLLNWSTSPTRSVVKKALNISPAETRSVIAGLRLSLELHHKLLVKVGVTSTDADEMVKQATEIAGLREEAAKLKEQAALDVSAMSEKIEECFTLKNQLAALISWIQPRLDDWKASGRGMCSFGRERMEQLDAAVSGAHAGAKGADESGSEWIALKLGDIRPEGYQVKKFGENEWVEGARFLVGDALEEENMEYGEFRAPSSRKAQP